MSTLDLKGVDGANPLGFLAAMGALRVATLTDPEARMGWRTGGAAPRPWLQATLEAQAFAEAVCAEARRVANNVAAYGDVVKTTPARYRNAALAAVPEHARPGAPSDADYFAAFACDAVVEQDGMVTPTLLSFSNGGGMQYLFKDFRMLAQRCQPGRVVSNVLEDAPEFEACTNLNWDPAALRSYALRWNDPNSDAKQTDVPLNVLAFLGLAAFPSMPAGRGLRTVGFGAARDLWKWPIWEWPLSYQVARTLLSATDLKPAGVSHVLASRRFSDHKRLYFAPALPA